MKIGIAEMDPRVGKRTVRDRWGEPIVPSQTSPSPASKATGPGLVERLAELYAVRGGLHYGEGVSQQEHALQAGWLAERDGAAEV